MCVSVWSMFTERGGVFMHSCWCKQLVCLYDMVSLVLDVIFDLELGVVETFEC